MPRWSTVLEPAPTGKTPAAARHPPTTHAQPSAPAAAAAGLHPAAPRTAPADLYARWAIATQWRGYSRGQRGARVHWPQHDDDASAELPVQILARAPDRRTLRSALRNPLLTVPDVYRQNVPGSSKPSLHFTAQIGPEGLDWLCSSACTLHWELASPVRPPMSFDQAETSGYYGPQRALASFRPPEGAPPLDGIDKTVASGSIGDAIAVIDFGCPFLNSRFCDEQGRSRVAALWDQDASRRFDDLPWAYRPRQLGYGRELSGAVMQELSTRLHQNGGSEDGDEATVYRRMEYLLSYDDPRRRTWLATHGAVVLDAAGGAPDPLAGVVSRSWQPDAEGAEPGIGDGHDAASRAPLLFVQLPALTAGDASGGSLGAQLLDGVRWVLDRCKPDARVVINISYGSMAGPHDGSSMIERALDELLELRRDNFAIVLAAGNARQAGCHLRRRVSRDRTALLRLALPPGDVTDTFVEVWYPQQPTPPDLRARVRSASRDWSPWVPAGGAAQLLDEASGRALAVLQHERRVPQSLQADTPQAQKALILLALAPTAASLDDDGPLNTPGLWEIEVALVDEGQPAAGNALAGQSAQAPTGAAEEPGVTLDAWVERDDPGEFGRGAAPRFVGLDRDDVFNTLSSIATGRHTLVVGGYRLSDGQVVSYSSLPDLHTSSGAGLVCAPCEESEDLPNLPGAAVPSNERARLNGTSIAAPVAARRLFNAMVAPGAKTVRRGDWHRLLDELSRKPRTLLRRAR